MSITTGYKSVFALALAIGLLGLAASSAAALPYTLEPRLSLTGDCSTSEADPIPDPDCAGAPPAYPPPPNRPIGRFDRPFAVAVDDWGNLYVASRSGDGTAGRIDIFDSEGHFISELPDDQGPQSLAVDGEGNLYVFEKQIGLGDSPEVVRYPPETYNPAAGEIAYDPADVDVVATEVSFSFNGLGIDRRNAADPEDDRLFIAETSRIREYGSAKEGNPLLATLPTALNFATYVAVDAQRRLLYTNHCKEAQEKCVVWVFEADAPYDFVKEIDGSTTAAGRFFSTQGWISLAVDETNGHLFVGDLRAKDDIYEYDEDHELVSEFVIPGGPTAANVQSAVANNAEDPDPADLKPEDNYRHLFVPLPSASGSALAFAPPSVGPPIIKEGSTRARGIGQTEAELEAEINPKEAETTYEIEYVTQAQFEIDGFESAQLAKSGTLPAVNGFKRVSAVIDGLSPGTAYRFRVFAENEFAEGEIGTDEEESSFATYKDAVVTPPAECSNGALMIGTSSGLPDCRAYELVTPADTNGRAPLGAGFEGERFGQLQASPAGEAVSFEILSGALPGFPEATGYIHGDPYVASRTAAGWSTALAGPNGVQTSRPKPGSFSPDQGFSFWTAEGKGTAVVEADATRYIRYPDGTSELLGRGSLGTDPQVLGRLITEDGTHVVFENSETLGDKIQLEPEAPPTGTGAVYDRTRDPLSGVEETHVVSLLPGDVTPAPGEGAFYAGASPDGEGIAFEIGNTLYLRVGNETTYEIGENLTFAGVSEAGGRIFYLQAGDLKAFDVASEEEVTFADTAAPVVPVNVASQGNRAYFVSEDAIAGSGPGPEGAEPQPGEQNLYLAELASPTEEAQISFIATVTERDVEGVVTGTGAVLDGLGLWTLALERRQPAADPSRLTPAGEVLVFSSRANLTGYDSGEFPQIYRYDHGEGRLHCLSCPPTATAATGGATLQSSQSIDIDAPFSNFGFVPVLAKDGERAFFESTEALVADDADGLRDVYEWEEEGIGSCKEAGGCVYLISSGGSARDDYLFGHSQSGDDVFISTADVLLKGDQDTISVYDAKVGGGFAIAVKDPCTEGEECKGTPTPPPTLPAPQSPVGPPGNVEETKKPKKCPKGKRKVKRKGKVVCVKRKQGKKQRKGKAGAGRRAGR